jgi:hypothetical protein
MEEMILQKQCNSCCKIKNLNQFSPKQSGKFGVRSVLINKMKKNISLIKQFLKIEIKNILTQNLGIEFGQ